MKYIIIILSLVIGINSYAGFGGSRSSFSSSRSSFSSSRSSFGGSRATSSSNVTITRPTHSEARVTPTIVQNHYHSNNDSLFSHYLFWNAVSNNNRPQVVVVGQNGVVNTPVVVEQQSSFGIGTFVFWLLILAGIVCVVAVFL